MMLMWMRRQDCVGTWRSKTAGDWSLISLLLRSSVRGGGFGPPSPFAAPGRLIY